MKHGQCCAACISPNDIEAFNEQVVLDNEEEKPYTEAAVKEEARRTNILLALSLANNLEKKSGEKSLKRASRIIVAGRLIVATGIFAALLFLFYEMFTLSLISSFLGVVGIFLCKLGMWKKHRIKLNFFLLLLFCNYGTSAIYNNCHGNPGLSARRQVFPEVRIILLEQNQKSYKAGKTNIISTLELDLFN